MKMDTLYWSNINSKIAYSSTVKIFFKKYPWRLKIYAIGGRCIARECDITHSLRLRLEVPSYNFYFSGYAGAKKDRKLLAKASVPLLESLKLIKEQFCDMIKMTIAEPYVILYAEEQSDLQAVVNTLPYSSHSCIHEISGPAAGTEDLLGSQAIITKRVTEYRYKICLRSGKCSNDEKKQILNYLTNLEDQILLRRYSRNMLASDWERLESGIFFYAKDCSITTFLELISPGIILNIHELVQAN